MGRASVWREGRDGRHWRAALYLTRPTGPVPPPSAAQPGTADPVSAELAATGPPASARPRRATFALHPTGPVGTFDGPRPPETSRMTPHPCRPPGGRPPRPARGRRGRRPDRSGQAEGRHLRPGPGLGRPGQGPRAGERLDQLEDRGQPPPAPRVGQGPGRHPRTMSGARSPSSPARPPGTTGCRSSSASWRPTGSASRPKIIPLPAGLPHRRHPKGRRPGRRVRPGDQLRHLHPARPARLPLVHARPAGRGAARRRRRSRWRSRMSPPARARSTAASGTATTTTPAATGSAACALAAGHALEIHRPQGAAPEAPGDGRSSAASRTSTASSGRTRWSPTPSPTRILAALDEGPRTARPSRCPPTTGRAGTSRDDRQVRRRRLRPDAPATVSKTDRLMVLCQPRRGHGDGEAPRRAVRHARLRRLHPPAGAREGPPATSCRRSRRSPTAGRTR